MGCKHIDIRVKSCCFPLSKVAEMLLELCVTELEDVASDRETGRVAAKPVVQESTHPYTDDTSLTGHVKIPGKSAVTSVVICAVLMDLM